MEQEKRTVEFDSDLKVEAYHFKGISQKFPNHFHEYYVIGFVEQGHRCLTCNNQYFTISTGDLVIFNPFDNHACEQVDGGVLDWRSLNIDKGVLLQMVEDITGEKQLPVFSPTVIQQSEAVCTLRELHNLIMSESKDLKKEEMFFFLIEQLITEYTSPLICSAISREINAAIEYMEQNYSKSITLNDLSIVTGLNKYTFLRSFTLQRGITPYQYLSTIRVGRAKQLLEAGVSPIQAAIQTGFSDQSHFTRFFKNFIGLTPKQYQNIFNQGDMLNREETGL